MVDLAISVGQTQTPEAVLFWVSVATIKTVILGAQHRGSQGFEFGISAHEILGRSGQG